MAEAKGLLSGTVSPAELRGLDCSNPWAVPFRQLLGRIPDTLICLAYTMRDGLSALRWSLAHGTVFTQGTERGVNSLTLLFTLEPASSIQFSKY